MSFAERRSQLGRSRWIPTTLAFLLLIVSVSITFQMALSYVDLLEGPPQDGRTLLSSSSTRPQTNETTAADLYTSLARFKENGPAASSRRSGGDRKEAVVGLRVDDNAASAHPNEQNEQATRAKMDGTADNTHGTNKIQSTGVNGETITENDTGKTTTPSWKDLLMPKIDPSVPRSWETDLLRERTKRPLNFVHIPKTGGSSIVEAGIQAGLNWGDCLFQAEWPGRTCPSPPVNTWPEKDPLGRVWWHVPVQYLPKQQPKTGEILHNPYHGMDLFGVIRNPYERAVSEVLYFCQLYGFCDGLMEDPKIAVQLLNQKVQNAAQKVHDAEPETVTRKKHYFFHDGHWIPQYDYFFIKRTSHPMIRHLLHTERLHEEFASLMQAYGLDVALPEEKVKPRKGLVAGRYPLGVQNLTLSTLQWIELVYKDDFELGGYPIISPILFPSQENRTQQDGSVLEERTN